MCFSNLGLEMRRAACLGEGRASFVGLQRHHLVTARSSPLTGPVKGNKWWWGGIFFQSGNPTLKEVVPFNYNFTVDTSLSKAALKYQRGSGSAPQQTITLEWPWIIPEMSCIQTISRCRVREGEKNPLLLVLIDDAILDNEQTCSLRTGEVCQEGMVITIN